LEVTDEGKPEQPEATLPPETPTLIRLASAALLLLFGVPALLGAGYCTL
jgi:hypothetical protein